MSRISLTLCLILGCQLLALAPLCAAQPQSPTGFDAGVTCKMTMATMPIYPVGARQSTDAVVDVELTNTTRIVQQGHVTFAVFPATAGRIIRHAQASLTLAPGESQQLPALDIQPARGVRSVTVYNREATQDGPLWWMTFPVRPYLAIPTISATTDATAIARALAGAPSLPITENANECGHLSLAMVGDELAISATINDTHRVTSAKTVWNDKDDHWQGPRVEVYLSADATNITQLVYFCKGPGTNGEIAEYVQTKEQQLPVSIPWEVTALPGGGYAFTTRIPLREMAIDPTQPRFYFEGMASIALPDGTLTYPTVFGSTNAFKDTFHYGLIVPVCNTNGNSM